MVGILNKISDHVIIFLKSIGKIIIRNEPKIVHHNDLFIPKAVWDKLDSGMKILVIKENNELNLVSLGVVILFVILIGIELVMSHLNFI